LPYLLKLPVMILNRILMILFKRSIFSLSKLSTGFTGPASLETLSDKGRKKIWRVIFDHIDEVACNHHIDVLEVRLTDIAPQYLPPVRKEHNPLWSVGIYDHYVIPPRLTVLLDLRKSEDQLLKDMDEDCRSEIKQAIKNGLTYYVGDYDDLGTYHKIHHATWTRTGLRPNSLSYLQYMWKQIEGHSKLLFAEYQGKTQAAVMIHTYKNGVVYWGGCSLESALKLRVNNYLLWSAVQWARSQGYAWFDIGLFQLTPGLNKKEYTVGRYKSQFCKTYYQAFEGKKCYTKKAAKNETAKKITVMKQAVKNDIQKTSGEGVACI